MKILIDERKRQLKANLHCHSVLSDGRLTPEQIKQEYQKRGYSVVAITDHERLVSHHDLTDGNFLFLTAYEAYIRTMPFNYKTGVQAHINLYSKTPENKMVYYTPDHTKYVPKEERSRLKYHEFVERREYSVPFVKEFIEKAHGYGYLTCHNHPNWSMQEESFADAYADCFAMEIYNHSSYIGGFTGYDRCYYEHQLRQGRKMAIVAADDNHNGEPFDSPYCDSFGGVTYILSDTLTYDAVVGALEKKEFYASTGPQIFSLVSVDGELQVKTSDAANILFWTNSHTRKRVVAPNGERIFSASFTPTPDVKWVCVEVTDCHGKKAFTRAFYEEEWEE